MSKSRVATSMSSHPAAPAKRARTRRFGDERGLSTVEYVILLVLVAVMSITAWKRFGEAVRKTVYDSTNALNENLAIDNH
jgi:Flp pilus assembly pilin Flp